MKIEISEIDMLKEFFNAEAYKFESKIGRQMNIAEIDDERKCYMEAHRGYPDKYIFQGYDKLKDNIKWYHTNLSLQILWDKGLYCKGCDTLDLLENRKINENIKYHIQEGNFNKEGKFKKIISSIADNKQLFIPIIILDRSRDCYIVLEGNNRITCYLYLFNKGQIKDNIDIVLGEIDDAKGWYCIE